MSPAGVYHGSITNRLESERLDALLIATGALTNGAAALRSPRAPVHGWGDKKKAIGMRTGSSKGE